MIAWRCSRYACGSAPQGSGPTRPSHARRYGFARTKAGDKAADSLELSQRRRSENSRRARTLVWFAPVAIVVGPRRGSRPRRGRADRRTRGFFPRGPLGRRDHCRCRRRWMYRPGATVRPHARAERSAWEHACRRLCAKAATALSAMRSRQFCSSTASSLGQPARCAHGVAGPGPATPCSKLAPTY